MAYRVKIRNLWHGTMEDRYARIRQGAVVLETHMREGLTEFPCRPCLEAKVDSKAWISIGHKSALKRGLIES